METQSSRLQNWLTWVTHPRFRAFMIAVVVLAILAFLQVNNLKRNQEMSELFTESQLQAEEVHRLQIAFGKAGLNEFEVRNRSVFVPADKRAEYIKVASDQNAIPSSLLPEEADQVAAGYLMTKQQLQQLQLDRKKRQVREMLSRLPFVDQVWFELDRADSGNAFRPARQSAVVSIRSPEPVMLTSRHVDSIRQMISGAIAGLNPEEIVVIDLDHGLAHEDIVDETTRSQAKKQHYAFEQKRFYESQIREALEEFSDLQIRVNVELKECQCTPNELTRQTQVAQVQQVTRRPAEISALPSPGANGIVSLEPDPPAPAEIELVNYEPRGESEITWESRFHVAIDVPESMVEAVGGQPTNPQSTDAVPANKVFDQLGRDIRQRIQAVLPAIDGGHQIAVNLLPSPKQTNTSSNAWSVAVSFLQTHWTSFAVVLIGLTLVTLVNRSSTRPVPTETEPNSDHDVLEINRGQREEVEPEIRLSQMIEEDPEAAAKIIETWIRDAA